jgi:outer membrane protein OmpA-like peptidoglycan-associated protein
MADARSNINTSQAKAEFVKNRLVAAGISGERVRVFGLGASKERVGGSGLHGDKPMVFVEIEVVR